MEDGEPATRQPHTLGTASKTIEAAKPLRSNCSEDLCKTTRLEARTCLAKTSTRTIGGSIATIKTVV
ncbi:Uncharacterised protein [Mycobacteroides abscessus subsp. abscessus]|nr:Uncharacterised protein [Mycobacteroides abscessus subsp. abscessus]